MRMRAKLVTAAATVVATMAAPGAALAHGSAGQGDLEMTIGFAEEPAYAGFPNAVQLVLTHDGAPVTDLGDGLRVEVSFGDQTSEPMPLVPWFEAGGEGTPGEYRAPFTPSQPGPYTFRFTGTVDGEEVDETMSSGPRTFSEVVDVASSEFPATEAPSTQELADRIEQESGRTRDAAEAAARAASAASDAADAASSARTLGLIGLLFGSAGLVFALIALASRNRSG